MPESDLLAAVSPVMPMVRVAVLDAGGTDGRRGRLTDVALPTNLPLREILPAVRKLAAPGDAIDDLGVGAGLAHVSLAPIGGAPFSLDATLDTVGVVDGDLLALQPIPTGPAAPSIVEDIADAAVIFSAAREKPWSAAHLGRAATLAVIGLVIVATTVGAVHRVATGQQLGLFTVAGVAALTVLGTLLTRARSQWLATALAVTALAPITAVFALVVPGDPGASGILLAAAGVTAWSIIAITVVERAIAFFTATTVVGGAALLSSAAVTLWQLDRVTVGCVLILIALLVTVRAAQLSALWARFPTPAIPAPGDATPAPPSIRVLEDLPRRVRVGDSHQTGFIAGSVLISSAGSVFLVAPQVASGWAWYLVVAAAAGSALRARVWDSAPCKAWLLSQPYLFTVALSIVYLTEGGYRVAWLALIALAALTLVWVVVARYPRVASPDGYSLPMRRLVGFLAAALDGSLIPVMAYLIGVFAWVLER